MNMKYHPKNHVVFHEISKSTQQITIKCPIFLLTFPPLATRTVRRVQPVKGGEELGSGSVGTWLQGGW